MRKKSSNISEKEFETLLKNNPKIKIASVPKKEAIKKETKISVKKTKIDTNKITILEEVKPEKKKVRKTAGVSVPEIIKINEESQIELSYSKEHFSIVLHGAKLLTINQIFAILQYYSYEIFKYKKSWHNIIKNVLTVEGMKAQKEKIDFPFFDGPVELTLLRQAPRSIDEDALTVMFKYIIDALKYHKEENPYGVIAEDNKKIVNRIVPHSEKGTCCLGIKLKRMHEIEKVQFTAEDILKP